MPSMLYNDYVLKLSRVFENAISEIEAEHNFEYGSEFEITLCKSLRRAVPDKYGIRRGYVVSQDGTKAGEDIIIYDKARFPTLRISSNETYDKKEQVPIEAVYAYIEAKHSLEITANGTYARACEQVATVKSLCDTREKMTPEHLTPYLSFGSVPATPNDLPISHRVLIRPGFPGHRNPVFGAVFARRVRVNGSRTETEDAELIHQHLSNFCPAFPHCPDVIVAGRSNIMLPVVRTEDRRAATFSSPFIVQNQSTVQPLKVPGYAFGTGIALLLYALDWIHLGKLPWNTMIADVVQHAQSGM